MGAAFLAHFMMNQMRTPSISPLGRFNLPDKTKLSAIATTLLIGLGGAEIWYLVASPDSSDSKGSVGQWNIISEFSNHTLDEGLEYISDGESLTLNLHTDSVNSLQNGNNIVAISVVLTYSEDETSGGLGCTVPGASQPDPDTITGTIMHDEYNQTGSGQNDGQNINSHEILIEWYNSSLVEQGNWSGYKSEIHDELNANGVGLGEYSIEIAVDVQTGGALGCQHTDDGEEVDYLVQLIVLDYTIEESE